MIFNYPDSLIQYCPGRSYLGEVCTESVPGCARVYGRPVERPPPNPLFQMMLDYLVSLESIAVATFCHVVQRPV